jgi:hypothetical protein
MQTQEAEVHEASLSAEELAVPAPAPFVEKFDAVD